MRDVSVIGFDLLVAVAQAILAFTLLARRRRPEWVWPLAGIFAANAGQAAVDAVTTPYDFRWSALVYQGLDLAIFLFFVHLALSFPERPRWLRGRWALPCILALTAVCVAGLHVWSWDEIFQPRYRLSNVPQLLVGYVFPAAAWTLLLGRWAWRWRGMPASGRETFQWLLAAFAMRAANIIVVTLPVDALAAPPGLLLAARLANWVPLLAVLVLGFALTAAFVREVGAARRQTVFVLGFLMAGFLEAIAAFSTGGSADFHTDFVLHLDILIIRPLLVWCAMALYDVGGPSWNTRWPGLAAVGALVLAVFSQGVRPGIEGALPGWQGTAAAFVVGGIFAVAVVLGARAWLASRHSGRADAASSVTWVPGQEVLGRYRIERLLGEGSTGAAYLAQDLRAGPAVVLKRTRSLSSDQRQSLLAEAGMAAGLAHPSVVRLLRVEQEGEEPVLVLEHVAGGSLRTRMAAGRLDAQEAAGIAIDVLSALEAAHAKGIVHRDLKPENVLLDGAGRAKLADFGSAEVARSDRALGDPTHAGPPQGSLRYMSPEQVRGRSVDGRTDLYSLAVMLHEMVAGRHPVPEGLSDYQVRRHIAEGPMPRLGAVPKRLKAVLARGLQKAPSRRFRSATEFRRALERLEAPGAQALRKTRVDRPTPSKSPERKARHSSGGSRSQLTKVPLRDPRSRTA